MHANIIYIYIPANLLYHSFTEEIYD